MSASAAPSNLGGTRRASPAPRHCCTSTAPAGSDLRQMSRPAEGVPAFLAVARWCRAKSRWPGQSPAAARWPATGAALRLQAHGSMSRSNGHTVSRPISRPASPRRRRHRQTDRKWLPDGATPLHPRIRQWSDGLERPAPLADRIALLARARAAATPLSAKRDAGHAGTPRSATRVALTWLLPLPLPLTWPAGKPALRQPVASAMLRSNEPATTAAP